MIIVDTNQASVDKNFMEYLSQSADVLTSPLETGDLQFWGKMNTDENNISICIEIKKVPSDLMASLRDGRLMTQLPRMVQKYDMPYLLLVGNHMSVNFESGKIQEKTKGKKWGDSSYSYHYLNSIINRFEASGGRVRHVKTVEDMSVFILSLYRFWKKDSHSEEVFVKKRHKFIDWKTLSNPLMEMYERMGIGVKKAKILAEQYPSLEELVNADEKDIKELNGFRGKTIDKIMGFIKTGR